MAENYIRTDTTHTRDSHSDDYNKNYSKRCSSIGIKKAFKNEQRSKDAAAKKRPTTSGVGKINNYYEDIYIPPYNNTDSPHLYIVTIPIDSTH